ncbi:MAG: Fic family protein [Planctomycetota bacterium]|nr:Fic family protein [Planctomycetota bacterium]
MKENDAKSKSEKYYSVSAYWYEQIDEIYAQLERVSAAQIPDILRLRKLTRIMSVHSSTAIEGNALTLGQVAAVVNGKKVAGLPNDIKEVQNAWQAYGEVGAYNPWSVADLLKAHALMTAGLVEETGAFRTVNVSVADARGEVLHRGSPPEIVAEAVGELLAWGKDAGAHPLVKSSAVHCVLEHIHPFRDGNGRIGRLWQSAILTPWKPLFAYLPIERVVHDHQERYYLALRESQRDESVNASPFIGFMLDAISNSLDKFMTVAAVDEIDSTLSSKRAAKNG